jgi:hypothetical protein
VARKSEPAWGGVPLPAGEFKKDQEFTLSSGGAAVPAQVLPLVVDEKGFVRWVLVDTQVDLAAKGKKELVLTAGKSSAKPQMAVKVTESADGVTVDTGRVKFSISKSKPFCLFNSVEAGGKAVVSGGAVSYTDGFDGKKYNAAKPASVAVEYQGPMRATLCVKGRFTGDEKNAFQYVARFTAWAGLSRVHVKYSLCNSNPDHYCFRQVKDSSIVLALADELAGTIVGADAPREMGATAWVHQGGRAGRGRKKFAGAAKAGSGGEASWTAGAGQNASGWIAGKTGAGVVCAADLYFAEDPARRMEFGDGELILTGVAQRFDGDCAPFGAKHRWIYDCSHLSSQYLIDFAAPADGKALDAMTAAGKGWLHLRAPSAWYSETEGFPCGKFASQADEVACNKTWGWAAGKGRLPSAPNRISAARYFRGADNHYDTEQDSVEAFLLMYVRSEGKRAYLTAGQGRVQHWMDLQSWRTDGWHWKDGGVWWVSPLGNRAQRKADPVTGARAGNPSTKKLPASAQEGAKDLGWMRMARECYCHCYAAGACMYYTLTGDPEAREVAVDKLEQQYDTNVRARKRVPGAINQFQRDVTRSNIIAHAVRSIMPTDEYAVKASEYFKDLYMKRPGPEPRGLVKAGGGKLKLRKYKGKIPMEKFVGPNGVKAFKESGNTFNDKTGEMTDPKTGKKWFCIVDPCTWQTIYMAPALDCYNRVKPDEDVQDWLIAYGQAVSKVVFQPKHYNLDYGKLLTDFPQKGKVWDRASWDLPADSKTGEGVTLSGYIAYFHVNIPAYAYGLCGEKMLKDRAKDYWYGTSHRRYNSKKMHALGQVGKWINIDGEHSESVCYTGRTFYIWAHPRKDTEAPAAVKDLSVAAGGESATVSFTAPADAGGGKVVRYQVKCSDKPIVDYDTFMKKFAAHEDGACTNWFLAGNVAGEPAPKAPGAKESFKVTGVPAGAKFFAVRAYDDSSNRSAMSNLSGE